MDYLINQETFVLHTEVPTFNTNSTASCETLFSKIASKISQIFSRKKPVCTPSSQIEDTDTKAMLRFNAETTENTPLLGEAIKEIDQTGELKPSPYEFVAQNLKRVFSSGEELEASSHSYYDICKDDFNLSDISKYTRRFDKEKRLSEVQYSPLEFHKQEEVLPKTHPYLDEETHKKIDDLIHEIDNRLFTPHTEDKKISTSFSFKNLISTFFGWFTPKQKEGFDVDGIMVEKEEVLHEIPELTILNEGFDVDGMDDRDL